MVDPAGIKKTTHHVTTHAPHPAHAQAAQSHAKTGHKYSFPPKVVAATLRSIGKVVSGAFGYAGLVAALPLAGATVTLYAAHKYAQIKAPDSLMKRIIICCAGALAAPVAAAVVAAIAPIAIIPIVGYGSHKIVKMRFTQEGKAFTKARNELKTELRRARFDALAKVCTAEKNSLVREALSRPPTPLDSHIEGILNAVETAQNNIARGIKPKEAYKKANELITDHLEAALTSPEYIDALKLNALDLRHNFVNELCAEMHVHEHDSEEIAKNALMRFADKVADIGGKFPIPGAKTTIDELRRDISHDAAKGKPVNLEKAADLLDGIVRFSEATHYTTNNVFDKVVHWLAHPLRTLRSIQSEHAQIVPGSLSEYTSFKTGNPNVPWFKAQFTFADGTSHEFRHIIAANSTIGSEEAVRMDPRYLAVLKHYQDNPPPPLFVQVQLQKISGEEGKRVNAVLNANQDNLHVNAYSVDGAIFEGKNMLGNEKYNPETYHASLSKLYETAQIHDKTQYPVKPTKEEKTQNPGVVVQEFKNRPEKTVEARTQSALNQTKLLMQKSHNKNFRALSEGHKARLHQYAFQLVSTMGEMLTAVKNNDQVVYQENCKEDIDRGATKNALTALATALLAGEELTDKKLLNIFAPIIGRAEATNDRAVIRHRIEPFLDLLKCMKSEDLKAALEVHLNEIGCMPSKIEMGNLFERKEQIPPTSVTKAPSGTAILAEEMTEDENVDTIAAPLLGHKVTVGAVSRETADRSAKKTKVVEEAQKAIDGVDIAGVEYIPNLQALDHAISQLEMLKTKLGIRESATGRTDKQLLIALQIAKQKREQIVAAHPDDPKIVLHEQKRALAKTYAISAHIGPTIYKMGISKIEHFLKATFKHFQTTIHTTPMDAIAQILRHSEDPTQMKLQDILLARNALRELKTELTGPDHDLFHLRKNDAGSFSLIEGYNPEIYWLPEDCDAALALLDGFASALIPTLTPAQIQALSPTEIQALDLAELDEVRRTLHNEIFGQFDPNLDDPVSFVKNNLQLVKTYVLVFTAITNHHSKRAHPFEAYRSSSRNDFDSEGKPIKSFYMLKRDLVSGNRDWTIVKDRQTHTAKKFLGEDREQYEGKIDGLNKLIGNDELTKTLLYTSNQSITYDRSEAIQKFLSDPVFVNLGLYLFPDKNASMSRRMEIDSSGMTSNTISAPYAVYPGDPTNTTPLFKMRLINGYEGKTADLCQPFSASTQVKTTASFEVLK